LGFGDLLVDPAQSGPGPVTAVLIADRPVGDPAAFSLLLAGHG
jgi:hypothetical protein